MSKRITFKLYGEELLLVQAFDQYCQRELSVHMPVDELLKRLILKYLADNVDREQSNISSASVDEQRESRGVPSLPPATPTGEVDAD